MNMIHLFKTFHKQMTCHAFLSSHKSSLLFIAYTEPGNSLKKKV